MQFTPKTKLQLEQEEEERELSLLLPKGVYDFECFRAEDKLSKSNNEMIAVGLKVYGNDGRTPFVNDWLLEKMAFKLRHFCETTELMAVYERGDLKAEHCLRASGRVQIDIEPAKDGYPAKNKVVDYGEPEKSDTAQKKAEAKWVDEPSSGGGGDPDGIPFHRHNCPFC